MVKCLTSWRSEKPGWKGSQRWWTSCLLRSKSRRYRWCWSSPRSCPTTCWAGSDPLRPAARRPSRPRCAGRVGHRRRGGALRHQGRASWPHLDGHARRPQHAGDVEPLQVTPPARLDAPQLGAAAPSPCPGDVADVGVAGEPGGFALAPRELPVVLVHRHDIDTDLPTARRMFALEQKHGVRASYYFRLSTLDFGLMRDIERYGSEASYHYEEIATYANAVGPYKLNLITVDSTGAFEKPSELMRRLLQMSASPGDLVYEPFAGSGSTLVAAKELGLDVVAAVVEERQRDGRRPAEPVFALLAEPRLLRHDRLQRPGLGWIHSPVRSADARPQAPRADGSPGSGGCW
mgnify:CR=1 FL=1